MNIIYPSLVEQAYSFMEKQGIEVSKDEVYKMQVGDGLITANGKVTKKAIDLGLVSEFNQSHETLEQFKKEYPIFKKYPSNEFTQQEGIWYISQKIINEISQNIEKANVDEANQLETYFNFRNYDNPHQSIAEVKGVYHPLYTPYPDDLFQIIDGLVAIPKRVMEDILLRCEEGELEVTDEQYKGFKELLEKIGD